MKFSYALSYHAISIEMFLEADAVKLYTSNSMDLQTIEPFKQMIHCLLTEDPDELYLDQLERNAENDNEDASGLGFLTLLNDYEATLAWRFEEFAQNDNAVTVTTMAKLTV